MNKRKVKYFPNSPANVNIEGPLTIQRDPAGKRSGDEKKGNSTDSDKWGERTRKTPIRYGLVHTMDHQNNTLHTVGRAGAAVTRVKNYYSSEFTFQDLSP